MYEVTNLYLVVFPERGVIKIGMANDVYQRIKRLRRFWGEADFTASYYLPGAPRTIAALESSLHRILADQAIHFEKGDGRTELFSISALNIALKHIESHRLAGKINAGVIKGISIRSALPVHQKSSWRYKLLRRKVSQEFDSVTLLSKQFNRIYRVMLILLRRQKRIAYEYQWVGDRELIFRVWTTSRVELNMRRIMGCGDFSFDLHDIKGSYSGVNFCSVESANENCRQWIFCFPRSEQRSPCHILYSYFFENFRNLLNELPQRSFAAIKPLTVL